mgnify:CR=1
MDWKEIVNMLKMPVVTNDNLHIVLQRREIFLNSDWKTTMKAMEGESYCSRNAGCASST